MAIRVSIREIINTDLIPFIQVITGFFWRFRRPVSATGIAMPGFGYPCRQKE